MAKASLEGKKPKIGWGVAALVVLAAVLMFGGKAGAEEPPGEPPPGGYKCPVCGQPFGNQTELQIHFTSAHPREQIPIDWD